LEIELDRKAIGTIAHAETTEAAIDPGHRVLKRKSGHYGSLDRAFGVGEVTLPSSAAMAPCSGRYGLRPSPYPTSRSRSSVNDREILISRNSQPGCKDRPGYFASY
jgi:hypothetical protein